MEGDAKKEAERLRKAGYRARVRSITNGTYTATPIELAKRLLEGMDDPEVAAAFQDDEIGSLLKPEDKKTL
jgi:hypothetical protein